MKKAIVFGLALALVGGVAYANFCARDVVPSATLLVPYVTVATDLSGVPDPNGQTTIFGVTNVSRDAVIVHFTAWDATSIPRIDFDEILSGYDVLQINWRDFLNGRFDIFDTSKTAFTIPSSPANLTFDPFEWGPDGRAQGGGLTTPANRNAITSNQCAAVPPYGNRSDLATTIRGLLTGVLFARDHGGCDDPSNLRGDQSSWPSTVTKNPIFFYVTADVVKACNLYFPNNTAYWADSIMTTNNVLIGDVVYLNAGQNYSEMYNAVHVEAAANVSREQVFPFYGEKTTAETRREPLGTAFAFRYANDAAGNIHSSVIFWKNYAEFNADDTVNDCGSYLYYAWDMDERSLSRAVQPISGLPTGGLDRNQFPFETQKVPLTNAYFDLPASYGWFLLVLPPSYVNSAGYVDPSDTTLNPTARNYMGWAGLQFTYGTYSAGTEAATMANYHCFANQVLPALGANNGATYISY